MNHNMFLAKKEGFRKAINKFADMTEQEYKNMLGYRPDLSTKTRVKRYHKLTETPNDATVDWRTKGAVTPVKN